MGAHGRRALERFFVGSTAENMLRKTPVPIMIVPQRFRLIFHAAIFPSVFMVKSAEYWDDNSAVTIRNVVPLDLKLRMGLNCRIRVG